MTRKATPANLLDELIPTTSETTAIRGGLRWDYSQAGDAADEVQRHAVEIKRSERRASEAIIEAGEHLLAVKGLLAHGQWLDWLGVEFGMSDRTAQRMMSVAEQFAGKSDTVSNLSTTVLYLLAADSTPEPARAAVLEQAQAGETVTKAQAQAVIDAHKPRVYESGLPVLDIRMPGQRSDDSPAPVLYVENEAAMFQIADRAYSGDTMANGGNRIRTPFEYDGRMWICVGVHRGRDKNEAFCIRVHVPGEFIAKGEPVNAYRVDAFIGRQVKGNGQTYLLGAQWLVVREVIASNGYASQSQIESWLKGIAGTPAELRQAAEKRTGRVYDALVLRAWSSDHYEVSPITASAALRNAATDREYAAKKAGADAVQRSVDATAAYREATQVVLVQPAQLREFKSTFEGMIEALADWALECGHQAEASAAARAIRACIEMIEKDLAE